jgi:hypothetical protein
MKLPVMKLPVMNLPVVNLPVTSMPEISSPQAAGHRPPLAEAPLRASAGFARPLMGRDAIARQLRVSLALAGLLSAGCVLALFSAWAPLV